MSSQLHQPELEERLSSLKVALVYDRVNSFGGAERVLEMFHHLFPQAPLYTSVYDETNAPWAKGWRIHTSWLQSIPFFRSRHQLAAVLMPMAFEQFDFSRYDLVISITSEAAKGIITLPQTRHFSYVLTPTRYLWSHTDAYLEDYFSGLKKVLRIFPRMFFRYLRWWDRVAAQRPDVVITLSEVVRKRIQQYYNRTSHAVMYPPVSTELFLPKKKKNEDVSSYFLCVGRLVPYKRIDLAIQAALRLKEKLVIVGKGSDEHRLRNIASGSSLIVFAGQLTETELVRYYQECAGVVYPGEEDFGLTVLEAMAAGRPSVVYKKSGHAEVVRHLVSGVVVQDQTIEAVAHGMKLLKQTHWNQKHLISVANTYNIHECINKWRKELCRYLIPTP